MPEWAWLGLVWLLASVCVTLGMARWFRFLRGDEDEEHRW